MSTAIRARGLVLTGGDDQMLYVNFENFVKLIINNRLVGQLVRFNGTFQQNLGYIALLGLQFIIQIHILMMSITFFKSTV